MPRFTSSDWWIIAIFVSSPSLLFGLVVLDNVYPKYLNIDIAAFAIVVLILSFAFSISFMYLLFRIFGWLVEQGYSLQRVAIIATAVGVPLAWGVKHGLPRLLAFLEASLK
jgi:hypothetical protein